VGLPPVNFEGHLRLYGMGNNSRAASDVLSEFSSRIAIPCSGAVGFSAASTVQELLEASKCALIVTLPLMSLGEWPIQLLTLVCLSV